MLSESQDQQLINLPQDSHDKQLWLEVCLLESRLRQIARLPITESTDYRDEVEQIALSFIHEQWIDAARGGFYHLSHQLFQFSCYQNTLVARALLNVDRVTLNGELRYAAINILNNLVIRHFDLNRERLFGDVIFPLHDSPICFSEELLSEIFSNQEFRLFVELAANSLTTKDEVRYYLSRFSTSLKQAAEDAKMEYKQAQILDSLIRHKLAEIADQNYKIGNKAIASGEQAEVLVTLTQAVVYGSAEQFSQTAQKIANCLINELQSDEIFSEAVINLCYALVVYNQIKFDFELINQVTKQLLLWLDGSDEGTYEQLSEQCKFQLRSLRVIFESLSTQVYIEQTLLDTLTTIHLPLASSFLMEPKVILLEDGLDDSEKRAELLARYDSRLMLFTL